MSVTVDISYGPHYRPGGEFRMDGLGLRLAILDDRYDPALNNNRRYLYVRSQGDLDVLRLGSLPSNDPWDNSLYALAGQVPYMVYKDVSFIQPSDNIDCVYLKPIYTNFVFVFNTHAIFSENNQSMLISNIDNMFFAINSLYSPKTYSALFFGYTHTRFYGKIYLATEYLLLLFRLLSQQKVFCGLIGNLAGSYTRPSTANIQTLIAEHINVATKKALINPVTLSGKLIHHVITNTWIRNRCMDIMMSYIGRENNPGLWDEARTELEAFGAFINSLPCGPINFRVILDERNNTVRSNTLHAEIQYYGATTDGFSDIQKIDLSIRL